MKHLLVVSVLIGAPAAAQTTILVPADQPTIQAGVAAAVDGDTVLVAPGTYNEQIDTLGKAITLRSSGGAGVTTIDSLGADGWPDFPFGPVIRMVQGETSSTVVEGFTIQGAAGGFAAAAGYSGVWCVDLDPTIRDCVIRGNDGGLGAGVAGNPHLDGCEIVDNDAGPFYDGGGVYGQPTVTSCVISGNYSGGLGGGIYATGPCTITDSVIDGNESGNGFDGYSGGGVFGPVTLVGCLITNNTGNHYLSGGPPDAVGTGVDGAVAMTRCTLVGNRVGQLLPGDPSGAYKGSGVINSCLFFDNEVGSFAGSSTPSVTYSILPEPTPGTGNQNVDPLLVDPAGGDYSLSSASPAIDAGDPALPLDPDGSVADVGAIPFFQPQAAATVVNGSGVNPLSYQPANAPVLGTTWSASIDASLHDASTFGGGVVGTLAPGTPLPTAFGELLINPFAPTAFELTTGLVGGFASFSIPVPTTPGIVGASVYTQGLALGTTVELANGIELLLGL